RAALRRVVLARCRAGLARARSRPSEGRQGGPPARRREHRRAAEHRGDNRVRSPERPRRAAGDRIDRARRGRPAMSDDLAFTPALELAEHIRARDVSSVELVELYLERIEQYDDSLNAYVTVDAEGALAAAHEQREGPFAGVPISIKDLTETEGLRTTLSTKALAENVPAFDTATVRRIRDAGFVILGKTNTPEFGTIGMTETELNGACRNPWDTSRTPGGSSGGAAAATAAALCPIAQGSDGGGSIRNPASCCGLVGIKPSRGLVSP